MKVAWFPNTADLHGNPYWSRLQSELEQLGVQFSTEHPSYWLTRSWLLRQCGKVSILHFHFIQPFYIGQNDHASFWRLLRFASDLILARLLGYRLVWTVHDLMPTWPKEPQWVERWGRYLIAHIAHDVIVHCQEAKHLVGHHFKRRRRVHILPCPSYADIYSNTVNQMEARNYLGLPAQAFVVGFVGGLRANKGLEKLIHAFHAWNQLDTYLLIAGNVGPPADYDDSLRRLAGGDLRIHIRGEYVPDDEMQYYLHVADVLVFPFQWVLTSSSVILAMSFSKPVIVPQLGCLTELVGRAGIVYETDKVDGLVNALQQAKESDLIAMGQAALEIVREATWQKLATETWRIYR